MFILLPFLSLFKYFQFFEAHYFHKHCFDCGNKNGKHGHTYRAKLKIINYIMFVVEMFVVEMFVVEMFVKLFIH